MPLHYTSYPNKLSDDEKSWRAVITKQRCYSFDDVIQKMMSRNLLLNEAEIRGVLKLFMAEVSGILEDGEAVSTPLFKAKCSIAGTFTGSDDAFYRNRHEVRVKLTAGKLLKKMAQQVSTRKTEGMPRRPRPDVFLDMISGERNGCISIGKPAMIKGIYLKFDPDDPEQGIFLENEHHKQERVTRVVENRYARLSFMVPADLSSGNYRLLVKSRLDTQQLRMGMLSAVLVAQ